MKRLYLIRHAKSDWSDPSQSDFDRPLNRRGEKNAPFMGKRLALEGITPDLILSSPAVRAAETARIIAGQTHYPLQNILYDETLYLADIEQFQTSLRGISDTVTTLFLVAHNPGLTDFARYLSGYPIENIPTCGLFCVELKEASWKSIAQGSATFVSFDYPKRYEND